MLAILTSQVWGLLVGSVSISPTANKVEQFSDVYLSFEDLFLKVS